MLAALASLFLAQPAGPAAIGLQELHDALSDKGLSATRITMTYTEVPLAKRSETYRIEFKGKPSDGLRLGPDSGIVIKASDANGALYGLLEAAERVRNSGKDAWRQPVVTGKPFLEDRGWNMFLPLPWDYDKNFVDNDPAALVDPNRWFFQNEDYWRKLFRLLALSRFNWLDIHGPYDLDTTRFPNLYAYFIQSDKFSLVGVDPSIKKANLERLRWIIRLAHQHGIRVSLMSYEARFDTPHNLKPPYKGTEDEVYAYTREVVAKMIKQVPELDKIGFRIGESGRGAEFFKCYTEAVKVSGRNIPLYTRSWVTRKARVVPLARESDDFTVEIKYNGEQWGAPYIMAGGRTANWYSYWYEDYLSDSGPGKAKRMWEGNESDARSAMRDALDRRSRITDNASRATKWPSQPYKIVWQVRANGTHRIFPFYQPEWTRRSILSMKLGTASGYTVESMCSYFPQEPRYYWAGPKLPYKWTFERDEMYIACWGRYGYDPTTPEWKFDRMLMRKYGPEVGKPLAAAWKEASKVVPLGFMAHGLGPDHRSHAPELETGGDSWFWVEGEPFDSHVFMSAKEAVAGGITGGKDGRLDPKKGSWLLDLAQGNSRQLKVYPVGTPEELRAGIDQLRNLGRYYLLRLLTGLTLAEAESKGIASTSEGRSLALEVAEAWERLSSSSGGRAYKPFTDRLRMHKHNFHWQELAPGVRADAERLGGLIPERNDYRPLGMIFADELVEPKLTLEVTSFGFRASIASTGLASAWLLVKPLPSSTFFHKTPMKKVGNRFVAEFKREPWGHCVSAEVELRNGSLRRIPDFETEPQPYLVVPSLQKPTPPIYSSEETMTFLKPEILDPKKYGWLLVATRGEDFHRSFNKQTQRKLLSAVERGMNLLIMQQDYLSGRYPLDWLPVKPTIVNQNTTVFDPGGALGLERFETRDAMWQPFAPSRSDNSDKSDESDRTWKVYGNGALASLQWGKGTIWMMQGRLVQRMHIPGAARNLKRLLEACSPTVSDGLGAPGLAGANSRLLLASISRDSSTLAPAKLGAPSAWLPIHDPSAFEAKTLDSKLRTQNPRARLPAILVDAGSEGDLSSSVIPDFMNAHDIPFLTLGEVIAKEQGMDCLTPVPGPAMDDDILGGKGRDMANAWLKAQVQKASKRTPPATLEAFGQERNRRRAELLRSLGLDTMPPKTPLNARITGTIQRKGYKIEKIVYESRPGFFVTGHLYLPDSSPEEISFAASRQPLAANQDKPNGQRFPVIVHVNGHWAHKKDEDRIQLRAAFCALQGYAAFAIDSPGHSFEGSSLIERRAEGNHNDWTLVQGGTNATGYYVWDVIRGLDYLATRADTDMTRIGLTGASGGGLATLYAFAAEDRFTACVPVVYMSSMETAPDNGCLCNHVPATCQVGDRSDVMAIQAPKPVYLFGAEVDPEFPPDAMRLTQQKMAKEWTLFGKDADAMVRIFPGGHDYSQPMRESMIGFFDKHLKGQGDGSPVPQPPLEAINPEDRQLLVLDPPAPNERTMRDLSVEYLAKAPQEVPLEQALAVNGGKPEINPTKLEIIDPGSGTLNIDGQGKPMRATYESEPGLKTPAVFQMGKDLTKPVTIVISDAGKAAQILADGAKTDTRLYVDILGTGELGGIEMRYPIYLGRSVAYMGGIQIAAAAKLVRQNGHGGEIKIRAHGPLSSQAAMWAALFEPSLFTAVEAHDALKKWEDFFEPDVTHLAVQPRAHLIGSLESLRNKVKNGTWKFRVREKERGTSRRGQTS